MKISIIAFNNLRVSPYINVYADYCKEHGVDCEIVYPNREGICENADCPIVPIFWDSQKPKLMNFLMFCYKVIRHLKQTNPDFVIVLTTMPAVLLSDFLVRHFKGRYLVDIRDYTYEHILPYYLLEKRVVRNSAMNVISSPGFRRFLPDAEYYLCHNVNAAYAINRAKTIRFASTPQIIIGYVGAIGYEQQCLKLMRLVEQDSRFCFYLFGNEPEDKKLSNYLKEHPCDRIKMFGPYQPAQKIDIMAGIDILFNAYGYGNELLDNSLSNKLYDSFYMRIPLLTSPNTAMSEEAGSFSFDMDLQRADVLDQLFDWYRAFDREAFDAYSEKYLKRVFREQDLFYAQLRQVLEEKQTSE